MSTFVTIHLVEPGVAESAAAEVVSRACEWFTRVEKCCSRFDRDSEVASLARRAGSPVPVSPMLFETLQFALAVAAESGGAFDPTVGVAMERRGVNRDYRTGETVETAASETAACYRDIRLDPARRTVTLDKPLMLDLGAVAKGLAIDMAARELSTFRNFAIDAGGDVYVAGTNEDGRPWSIGIRHPRDDAGILETIQVSGCAVCTSGDYERSVRTDGGGHILDPRSGRAASGIASATVVAPTAILADALATAAFVLGPAAGIDLLNRHGVAGLLVSPTLERYTTDLPVQPAEPIRP
jgi:thiamine biosynthesis lipoprotein